MKEKLKLLWSKCISIFLKIKWIVIIVGAIIVGFIITLLSIKVKKPILNETIIDLDKKIKEHKKNVEEQKKYIEKHTKK